MGSPCDKHALQGFGNDELERPIHTKALCTCAYELPLAAMLTSRNTHLETTGVSRGSTGRLETR